MADPVFPPAALEQLNALYPERAGTLTHALAGHPLLSLDALAALAGRMRAIDVEHNLGDLPVGIDPAEVRRSRLDPQEIIASIEANGSWMVLKFVEQDPAYRDLLHATLQEIAPIVAPRTGAMLKLEGFVFISSPGAVTPFHFDPEHNILLQIRGRKTMTIFPAGDPAIANGAAHEAFHLGGHRNLPYCEEFASQATALTIGPGEAIYVPVKSPHWVKNGDAPSVSFSITWRSEWSYREADARGFNHLLRSIGLDPADPGRYPQQNHVKSIAWRTIGKVRRIIGAGRM